MMGVLFFSPVRVAWFGRVRSPHSRAPSPQHKTPRPNHSALERTQPRVVSFEEQVTTLRENLAALLESEERWAAAAAVLAGIEHAGEVLLGQHTPFSAGNYLIGIPATLPTSGYARVTSGVTALAFTKTISLARASAEALAVMAPAIVALADHEGFPAHAAVIHERLDPQG